MRGRGWWETRRLIVERLKYTGGRCFTYQGLRRTWVAFVKNMDCSVDWHTVERTVRKMVEAGLLERVRLDGRKKKVVVFCPTRAFWEQAGVKSHAVCRAQG